MTAAPRRLLVPVSNASAVVDAFRPGSDRCRILVTDPDTTVRAEYSDDGVILKLASDGGDRVVHFPGLDALPLDDVVMEVAGDRASRVRLRTLFDAARPARPRRQTTQFVVRPGQPLPTFSAFVPGKHMIEIAVDLPDDRVPDVQVIPSATGSDGVVLIDGRPTAILAGAPSATAKDLRLVPKWETTSSGG